MRRSGSDHRTSLTIALAVTMLLAAGCAPMAAPQPVATGEPAPAAQPQAAPAATGAPTPTPANGAAGDQTAAPASTEASPPAVVTPAVIPSGWQVYANPAGFAVSYPPSWTAEAGPDSNNGSIHTETLKGPEGEVHLSWGVGFGGACPSGYAAVNVAQGMIQACYGKNADGTEAWTQMSHPLPGAGFSGRALTSSARPANRDVILQVLATLTFAPAPAEGTAAPPVATYADPFAYCAAVGTIDAPDARYTGPKTPNEVLPMPVGPGTPSPFPEGSVYWRCMDGQVYSCAVGANIPCWDKADTSTTPSAGMESFCKEQPNADAIPAVAAGRETIYAWSCKDGVPAMGRQVFQVDGQGYIADYWQQIPGPRPAPSGAGLANPASQNCVAQGGRLEIENGPAGQFGVCYFEDNRQCEEWALMRADCPVGGIKVTGEATPAARYCAIRGGQYAVTGKSGQADEQGTCTLKDGRQCDAWSYYQGGCEPTDATPAPAGQALQPPIAEVCNGMAQAMMQALSMEVTQSKEPAPITDPVDLASGMACRAMVTGTGEQFASPDAPLKALAAVLTGGGWQEDMQLAAGGPTGMGTGFRSGQILCLAVAGWIPDASAKCPTDKPITECQLTPAQKQYTVTLDCAQAAADQGAGH